MCYNPAVSGFAVNFRGVTAAVLLAGGGFAAAADTPVMPPVGTVAQVRALTRAEAELQPQVTLRGVVTYCRHLATSDATVQDATGGIWLPEMPLPAGFKPGVEVEITGRAAPGVFGPIVRAQTVRVLGAGSMPAALPVNYEELLATRLNSQRVELTGVIRSQRVNPEAGLSWLAIELASGGGRVTVNVTHEITAHPELVGARVRVSGVCLHSPNPGTQQVLLPSLNVHELKDITILSPGVTRPFDLPVVPMNQLLSQSSQSEADRLVHVRGIVTLVPPHGPLAVQDDTRGLRVWLRDEGLRPHPGELVDVAGFPEPGGYSPLLRDAEWQLVALAKLPAPLAVEPADASAHEGGLLTVRGVLAAAARGDDSWTLTIENGPARFSASIQSPQALPWQLGSELEVTGVCEVAVGSWESFVTNRQPQGFSLIAQDFDSVRLIYAPPWWTPLRMLVASGTTLVVVLGVLWFRSRRHLREERHAREKARALFAAVFGERNRMAGEIHDTFAQNFAGISVQLEALGDQLGLLPDGSRRHLDLARQLVRQGLSEARRSVWALRPQALEEGTLAEALAQIGQQLTEGSPTAFELRSTGTPRQLPATVEDNLLRTGQEALTNAVRHAGARHIALTLDYQDAAVCLAVTDDGHGLATGPSDGTDGGTKGGFGLSGMRARARAIGAKFNLRSAPGAGTTIELVVPHV